MGDVRMKVNDEGVQNIANGIAEYIRYTSNIR